MGLTFHSYEPTLNGEGRDELVVRKDIHSNGQWNAVEDDEYATSDIDTWLNGTYKGYFSEYVQSLMETTKFYYVPGGYHTPVSTLERSVFLASCREIAPLDWVPQDGTQLPIAETLKIAYFNGAATEQWTRTPANNSTSLLSINPTGVVNSMALSDWSYGRRPVFCLPANTLISLDLNLVEPA